MLRVEIKIAKSLKKKIIVVKPYGTKKIPFILKKNADLVISDNIKSIKKNW